MLCTLIHKIYFEIQLCTPALRLLVLIQYKLTIVLNFEFIEKIKHNNEENISKYGL